MRALIVGAIDEQSAHAHVAHYGEGDLLRAGGHGQSTSATRLIAGVFWFSHHRRLMRQPYGSRPVVFINLFFLLSIILLPVTSSLDGSYGQSSVIAVLYGLHLSTIAALNAWLWWIATRDRRSRHELRPALFALLVLLLGTLIAAFAPQYARYFWLLAFGGVLLRRSVSAGDEVGG